MPSPSPNLSTILQRLRAETRPYHDALEQGEFNQALAAGQPTAVGTERFLAKLYGFLQPFEDQLRHHSFRSEWQLEQRRRAHLIPLDLPAGTPLPLCPAMPPLASWAQVLGAMYVLEGSTLGGQVIARQLERAGITQHAYFSGNAEQTGTLWKQFCQLLTEAAASGAADPDEIVASARRTFQHLDAWINQP